MRNILSKMKCTSSNWQKSNALFLMRSANFQVSLIARGVFTAKAKGPEQVRRSESRRQKLRVSRWHLRLASTRCTEVRSD